MRHTPPAHSGRARHWLIDALIGGGLALGLITVANAALPRIEHGLTPQRAQPRPAARTPVAPALPPALIAFQAPAPGYPVISPFGLRKLPWEEGGRLHAGVDIAAPAGLPVLAAADGVVTRTAVEPGYGRFVEVKHAAGISTIYAHLGRFVPKIAPGVAVKAGWPLGEIGSTGTSTGSHVHFEVRDDKGRPLNPELFLGRRFAEADDLPLRAAAKIPRQVRVAYVSNIPRSKREVMAAKEEAKMALATADRAVDVVAEAGSASSATGAPAVGQASVDAAAAIPEIRLVEGRPQARFQLRN